MVTYSLNEWRNEHWTDTLESFDSGNQLPRKMTNKVMQVLTPKPPLQLPGGPAFSDSEKEEALADSPKSQSRPLDNMLDQAVTETINEAMCTYKCALPPQVNEVNQTLRDPIGHQRSHGWQGSEPEMYLKQGPET